MEDNMIPQKMIQKTTRQASPAEKPNESSVRQHQSSFHHFRYVVIVVGGLMMGYMFFLRLNIVVPMVSMVNKTALYLLEHPDSSPEDYFPEGYVETGEFVWTNEVQQLIMSGYMMAYCLPQLFTTRLALRMGMRSSIAISLAICALSSLLTPVASYWGWQWTLALRLTNAVGASAIMPSLVDAIGNWCPAQESPKALSILQFVANFGYISAPLASGALTSMLSWKAAFYIPATGALFLCVLWYALVSDQPDSSKFLSQEEFDYIKGRNSHQATDKVDLEKSNTEPSPGSGADLPWYFMFKIKSFYHLALVWLLYCSCSGGFLFLLPNYLNRILKVPVDEIGALNATVHLGSMISMIWPPLLTSLLQNKLSLNLTSARRIVMFISLASAGSTYVYLAMYHDNLVLVVTINRTLHIANETIFLSTVMSQFRASGLSGLIFSMINTIGNLGIVFLCWAIGKFLDHTGETLECWSFIFLFMTGLVVLHYLVYAIFCHSNTVEVKLDRSSQTLEAGNAAA